MARYVKKATGTNAVNAVQNTTPTVSAVQNTTSAVNTVQNTTPNPFGFPRKNIRLLISRNLAGHTAASNVPNDNNNRLNKWLTEVVEYRIPGLSYAATKMLFDAISTICSLKEWTSGMRETDYEFGDEASRAEAEDMEEKLGSPFDIMTECLKRVHSGEHPNRRSYIAWMTDEYYTIKLKTSDSFQRGDNTSDEVSWETIDDSEPVCPIVSLTAGH